MAVPPLPSTRMAGIGETLRAERPRQGRSLADAAAETRVRESYLAAIEEDDFAVLGGDVYARGFIRLYGRYLDLDAEALVEAYRANHDTNEEVAAFPGSSIDDILPPDGGPRLPFNPAILGAVGLVALLVIAFFAFRGGGEAEGEATEDPNAPGPSPAEVAEVPDEAPTEDDGQALANTPADPLVDASTPAQLDGPALTEVVIEVAVLQPVRLNVVQGQPPVSNAQLDVGDSRTLTGDPAVVFRVSDAAAVDITVNGLPLVGLGGPGQAVEVSCAIGEQACQVRVI